MSGSEKSTTSPSIIRVMLADSQPAMLAGIRHVLSKNSAISVTGTAQNSTELIEALDKEPSDVLVSDYVMQGSDHGNGMLPFSRLRQRYPDMKVVLLTILENPLILHSLLGRRYSIVSKRDSTDCLSLAVHAAYEHFEYLSPRIENIAQSIKRRIRGSIVGLSLTSRELEVVRLFVAGMTVNEIAAQLHRDKRTISTQKRAAMRKMAINRDIDLIRYVLESEMLS